MYDQTALNETTNPLLRDWCQDKLPWEIEPNEYLLKHIAVLYEAFYREGGGDNFSKKHTTTTNKNLTEDSM